MFTANVVFMLFRLKIFELSRRIVPGKRLSAQVTAGEDLVKRR
jgi:hypothetical protein